MTDCEWLAVNVLCLLVSVLLMNSDSRALRWLGRFNFVMTIVLLIDNALECGCTLSAVSL